MIKEVAGINLETLEGPIRAALTMYEELSGGELMFDVDQAAVLEPTPEKSNSARSVTEARHRGEAVGKLAVIAFKPGDGSGDESAYKLKDLAVSEPYPRTSRVVPRIKASFHNEGHLTVVTNKIDDPNAVPELFAGTLDLLGRRDGVVVKIGELGQKRDTQAAFLAPRTTFTVGYDEDGKRFGDPHAVFSSMPDVLQVGAFLAISHDTYRAHGDVIQETLEPVEPRAV